MSGPRGLPVQYPAEAAVKSGREAVPTLFHLMEALIALH